MNRAVLMSALLSVPLFATGLASAQTTGGTNTDNPSDVTVRGPERLVCRAVVRTATRMRSSRVCRPVSQWNDPNRPRSEDEALEEAADRLDVLGADDAGTNDDRNPMDRSHDTPLGPR